MKHSYSEQKGFTLAELLIVVGIVAVLVAIAIPVFTAQLDRAHAATDEANIRSGYGGAQSLALSSNVLVDDVFVLLNDGTVAKQTSEGGTPANAYITTGESKNVSGASDSGTAYIAGQEVTWTIGQTVTYTVIEGKKVIIRASGGNGDGGDDTPSDDPSGGNTPEENAPGSVTLTDKEGGSHIFTPATSSNWDEMEVGQWDQSLAGQSVYFDSTGTYIVINRFSVGNPRGKTLAQIARENSSNVKKIDSSATVWTTKPAGNHAGDLYYDVSTGKYYICRGLDDWPLINGLA